jgi:hypothetical protein
VGYETIRRILGSWRERAHLKVFCAAIAAGATMAIPAKAGALTTLGPTAPPAAFNLSAGSDQTYFNTAAPPGAQLTAPADGVMTRFRTAANKTVTPRIIRKSGANYIGAGTGPQVPALGTGIQVTTETHMPIAAGDTIGMDLPAGTTGGGGASGWTLTFTQPAVPDGGPPQPGFVVVGDLAYVNADFELDNDQDKFGDETQDKCVGTAGTTNGCPNTVTSARAAQVGKSPRITVTATVPGAGTLKAGDASDASVASASAVKLTPVTQNLTSTTSQQVPLTLSLTKQAKKKLKKKGKLKVQVKVLYTPPGGTAGAPQVLKVKLKSKKKK